MAVKRIVANVAAERIDAAKAFYGDALGMAVVMTAVPPALPGRA